MHISKTTSNGKKKQHHVNICIPKEVVVEILQRVPGQDLYQTLKEVCMLWCSIIYSGRFAYSHVERGILKSSSSFSQLEAVIVSMTDDKRSVIVSALEWHSLPASALEEEHERYLETKYIYTANDILISTIHRMREMMRVNSVNGFVCFCSDDACLHVCSPITTEYFTTPPYSYNTNNAFFRFAAVGFGFCELSYEYKLMSWRSLKAIPDTQIISGMKTGAHVKGVLYWYKKSFTHEYWPHLSERIERLICFDLSKEEFDMIMISDEIDGVQGDGQYVYVAHSTTDLSSINSWKKEFTVTIPNMAYNIKLTVCSS
ncbi:hypothetical protein T459_28882 [Capsicum annuum]|uniref:F-box domain-containing protein n=1 Tax=Capsicum annuum TaxID=4072 RepID=A0A2G2YI42_CAPAN|nr:hypothetical protein FXO37_34573 [Capsicum annuum]PHT69395.1 hypothetical protein T459_28882 [Capsicum annuum]